MKGERIVVKNQHDIKNMIENEKSPKVQMKLVFLNLAAHSSHDFEKICELFGVAVSTGYQWAREWNKRGYESVKEKENKGGRPPRLSDKDLLQLEKYLEENKQWKTKEVKKLVKDRFDVDFSDDQIARIIKQKLNTGFSKNDFFENTSDAIIITNLDDIITDWNQGAEKILGWTAREAAGEKLAGLIIPPELEEERHRLMHDVPCGRKVSGIDTVCIRKDGTRINVNLTAFPLRNKKDITGLSYILRDITRLHAAKVALKESEEKLRDVIESAPIGILITNSEGRVVEINSTGLKIFGYDSKEEFLRIPASAHYYDPHDSVHETRGNGKAGEFEARFMRHDGTVFWCSVTSVNATSEGTNQYINVFRDITERRRTEEVLRIIYDQADVKIQERTADLEKAGEVVQVKVSERQRAYESLRESEEDYRKLVELSPYAIAIMSEGKVVFTNKAGAKLLGTDNPRQLIGKNVLEIIHPDYQEFVKEKIPLMEKKGNIVLPTEEKFIRLDGSVIDVEVTAIPFTFRKKTGVQVIIHDITERKQNERRLLEQTNLLEKEIVERRRVERELHKVHDELEIRIEERTAELARTNEALEAEIVEHRLVEKERERLIQELLKEQRHAEKLAIAIKKERNTLNIIMENTETQLAYLDSKFNFIRVNSAYANASGHKKEELAGHNYFELFPNPENQAIFEKVRDTCEPVEFKAMQFEYQDQPWRGITYRDWTLTPLKEAEGHVDRFVLSLTDVTERIIAEQYLQTALVHAETIIDTIPQPLVVLDAQLRVNTANHAFYKFFKVPIEETRNKLLCELGNRQWDIPELQLPLQRIIPDNKYIQNFEITREFPNIGQKTMLLNARQFFQEGKGMILLAIEDLTERKKIEEIRFENERLISASKTRSEFLAIVSHELRTPLTSILGYSILLQEKAFGGLNQKQEFYVGSILSSSNHLLSLINTILDIAKMEAGKLELVIEKIPVSEMINEIIVLIKERAEKHNIILETQFDIRLEHIEADRQKFKQIFFNLLSNAIKFSKEEGGIITISTKNEGDAGVFSVRDTGIGIRKEDMQKLFREFVQIDSGISRKYEGTGLGLVITKQLVELHGGRIMAESEYGKGSVFTFFLPLTGRQKN
ncbi:MAG: PAS domain S-box protein [Candidatus Methanoperedens sp.]|nr:PAS domain S-box protein [Candidatus Methanoperedens sp.]